MNTPHNRTRRGAAILFSGILVLGGLAVAGDASAEKDGNNPSCADLGYDFGEKREDPSGTYTVDRDGMKASLTVGTYNDVAKPNLDNAIIAADIDTKADGYAVVVKGGNGYTEYPNTEAVPMHAPAVSSEKWPTISHFQLCWNKPAPAPDVGQLKVTKVVTGEGAPADVEFEIGVTPSGGGETLYQKVKGGGTVTFGNLPTGDYVVTEKDPGPLWAVKGSGVTVTVELEDTAVATVTNTWITTSEEFGRVEVTKAVTGDGAPTDGKYEICLTGPDPSTTKVCKTVTGKGTLTFEDLVPGTYTVTETDPGTEYKVTITPAAVKVTIGEVATATVTNEYTQQASLPPTVPVTPTTPAVPVTPAAPTQVAAQSALPTTGSEGGLAAIAAVLVAAGVGLTLLSKRRGAQQA